LIRTLTACKLRDLWRGGAEVALFDVREEGPYADAHPFFAVPLPLSHIELKLYELVPRRSVPVVVYDNGEGLNEKAARLIESLGYSDVSILEGGLKAYAAWGELFRDVNVPNKAFGELVETTCHTPSVAAGELEALLRQQADVVVLDVRQFHEYQTMSVPTAISVPGGEIALRARDLIPSSETLVIVNCAGRTRSIIGTQTLVNAGISNRVAALRNGTIGWTLAGYNLDRGQSRRFVESTAATGAIARESAAGWAQRAGVRMTNRCTFNDWIAESERRTLYRFDVRTPEEYATGHPSGFVSAPGGQLVQATDEWAAVRGARIVLFDDDGVRARMTASWLVQMGWEAVVLEEGALECDEAGFPAPLHAPLPECAEISAAELFSVIDRVTVVDLASSVQYHRGHIVGAQFLLRSRFPEDCRLLPNNDPIVVTSPDGALARYAANELAQAADRPVRALTGGTAAWRGAGYPIETEQHAWISPPIDVYKRPYEGTDNAADAMQAYIEWELQLVAQMERDGIANFRVIT
jgi:rhodanese-related sulfurtransferase